MWGFAGLVLGATNLEHVFAWAAVAYAIAFAIGEALSPRIRAPTTKWQVPSAWVTHGSAFRRISIWGAFLGPGIATRNAYASMWLVPLLLGTTSSAGVAAAVGAAAGAAHGVARLAGILRVRRTNPHPTDVIVLRALRWRSADAVLLALVGGAVVGLLV